MVVTQFDEFDPTSLAIHCALGTVINSTKTPAKSRKGTIASSTNHRSTLDVGAALWNGAPNANSARRMTTANSNRKRTVRVLRGCLPESQL